MRAFISIVGGLVLGFMFAGYFTHIAMVEAREREMDLLTRYQADCEIKGGNVLAHDGALICAAGSLRRLP